MMYCKQAGFFQNKQCDQFGKIRSRPISATGAQLLNILVESDNLES